LRYNPSMNIKHKKRIAGIPPESLVKGLRALAPHLKPDEAAKAARFLAEEMVKVRGVPREFALFTSGLASGFLETMAIRASQVRRT
jgi:hypothetical protein